MKSAERKELHRLTFGSVDEVTAYQFNALLGLLDDCSGHHLLKFRMKKKWHGRQSKTPFDEILATIEPGSSEDQRNAIESNFCEQLGLSPEDRARIVFSTSGTSGNPKLLLCGYEEMLQNSLFHGVGYSACGIGQADTVATFGEVGVFAADYAVFHALSTTGCTIVPFVNRQEVRENTGMMGVLGVNILLAMQSELFQYLDYWENNQEKIPKLQALVTGGEPMADAVKLRLRALFGDELCIRATLQTADAGTLGYQCTYCEPDVFHVHEALQLVEIINDSGQSTQKPGSLITTNLLRRKMPVVRMKTGDKADWIKNGNCACGSIARRIRLLGRDEVYLKFGGEKLPSNLLQSLAENLSLFPPDISYVVRRAHDGRDTLIIQSKAFNDEQKIAQAEAQLYECALIQRLVKRDAIAPVQFEAVQPVEAKVFNKFKLIDDQRSA